MRVLVCVLAIAATAAAAGLPLSKLSAAARELSPPGCPFQKGDVSLNFKEPVLLPPALSFVGEAQLYVPLVASQAFAKFTNDFTDPIDVYFNTTLLVSNIAPGATSNYCYDCVPAVEDGKFIAKSTITGLNVGSRRVGAVPGSFINIVVNLNGWNVIPTYPDFNMHFVSTIGSHATNFTLDAAYSTGFYNITAVVDPIVFSNIQLGHQVYLKGISYDDAQFEKGSLSTSACSIPYGTNSFFTSASLPANTAFNDGVQLTVSGAYSESMSYKCGFIVKGYKLPYYSAYEPPAKKVCPVHFGTSYGGCSAITCEVPDFSNIASKGDVITLASVTELNATTGIESEIPQTSIGNVEPIYFKYRVGGGSNSKHSSSSGSSGSGSAPARKGRTGEIVGFVFLGLFIVGGALFGVSYYFIKHRDRTNYASLNA